MTTSKYEVRYRGRSSTQHTSRRAALAEIRGELGVSRLVTAEAADGVYCYQTAEDKRRDQTGARAFAVLCGPGQQQD